MKKKYFFILFVAVLFAACSNPSVKTATQQARGVAVYGGVLSVNETENYKTLYPISIVDNISWHIATQIFEGLVKFNAKDLTIIPCIAEKWDVNSSGTKYVFHIKKGVFFHDNPCFLNNKGRELKASDVLYSFKLLCSDSKENYGFSSTFKGRVLGADKFFSESKLNPNVEIEGLKIIDDYTVEISLVNSSSSFLYALATPIASIVAKEAVEKYGIDVKVGTGPFVYKNETHENLVLVRNNKYHEIDSLGNRLPFLDSIMISFLPLKKQELEKFEMGNLSVISGLPSESIKELVESQFSKFKKKSPKYFLERTPEMVTQYYEFNLSKPPFNNIDVRKAFSYAIDRNKIVEEVLKGEAYAPGTNGITPPVFKGYDVSKLKGYDFDPEKAKKLLTEAGYPNGKNFPKVKIELNSGGAKNANVVMEIQKQLLRVLNVNVDFELVSLDQKIEDQKYARPEISRGAWVADFPSPENFLLLFYGAHVPASIQEPSFPNCSRYKNTKFDKLFEQGKAANTQNESYLAFMKAEQLMLDDAPVMVLWYEENFYLIKSNVHNYYTNPMRFRDYSQVYLKDITTSPVDVKKE